MNKLTFLLPLKDRPDYTKVWLEHNLRPEYDYLIADGSIGDENEALFRDVHLPNLTYVRYQKDLSIDCYVEKMLQAIGRISTPYIMTCDNDDFINFCGVVDCIAALEKNPAAVSAGGPIYGIYQNRSAAAGSRYSLPLKILDSSSFHNRSGFDALARLFKNYGYMWYSIFRAEDYRNVWRDIRQLQVNNVFLMEILQAELAFCYGKYLHVGTSHYLRLLNPDTSAAREASTNETSHTHKIYFDEEYREQVIRMSGHVAKLANVDLKKLLDEFKFFYIDNQRMAYRVYGRLTDLARRKLVRFLPFLPMKQIISLVNILSRKAAS